MKLSFQSNPILVTEYEMSLLKAHMITALNINDVDIMNGFVVYVTVMK